MLHTSVSTRRSGMVLLIVMVLLSMVGLSAVTFLLTTGQLKDAANQNRRMGEITVDPEAMLQDGIMTIIRGTNNSDSAVYQNSLLEDMYGTSDEYAKPSAEFNGTFGTSNGMVTISGGQQDYAGCVITCVDETSPAYRRSTVVLKYQDGQMYCLPFPDGATFNGSATFIVNKLPYQQPNHDYDKVDGNNYYLAGRDVDGKVSTRSFSNATSPVSGEVDADNDGYADSKWLDLGMPVFTYKDGTRFKPLFGVVIEDMDGKLNVNAAGNWPSDSGTSTNKYGMGHGPAEIAWERTLSEFSDGKSLAKSLFNARLSAQADSTNSAGSEKPDHIVTSDVRGPWYEEFSASANLNDSTSTNVQRIPHDVLGKWDISVTNGNLSFSPKSMGTVSSIGGSTGNTYDRDLGLLHPAGIYSGNGSGVSNSTDMPFSPMELEAIIRPYDFDTPFLPQRLKNILSNGGSVSSNTLYKLAHLITTESWDLPISKKLSNTTNLNSCVPEVAAGWQIDLLRAAAFTLKDDDWQGTCYPKRQQFMQSIYEIMRDQNLDPGGSGDTVEKRRAQWAANVVDFIDVDNAMTPFKPMGADFTVFGCEQPELLITETLAIHSRNTEPNAEITDDQHVGGYGFDESGNPVKGPQSQTDTNIYENYKIPFTKNKYPVLDADGHVQTDQDGHQILVTDQTEATIKNKLSQLQSKQVDPDGIIDWDQYLRPQGALFVQLYHPVDSTGSPNVANDIYKNNSYEIDLSKMAGSNPVWRLVVTDDYTIGDEEHNLKRDTATWPQTGNTGDCFAYHIRMVLSFNKNTSLNVAPDLTSSSNNKYFTFYPRENPNITPSGTLLIGPSGQTVFQFNKNTKAGEITGNNGIQKSVTINGNTFSSIGGLGNGNAMGVEPIGSAQTFARFSLTEPRFNVGTSGDYYGPDTSLELNATDLSSESPLDLEVDSTWGLFSKNPNAAQILKRYGTDTQNRCIVHLQRLADPHRAWNNDYNPYITVDSMIVDLTVMNARITTEQEKDENKNLVVNGSNPTNIFSQQRNNTYVWEQNSKTNAPVSTTPPKFGQIPSGSKPWLGWINTTPVSPFQLMNVTNRCSSELMYHFNGEGSGEGLANTYGYLPNFSGELRKIIGFFRVPTPQIVSPMVLNPYYRNSSGSANQDLPAAYYTMYREPGKINLNTANELVLKSLLDTDATVTKSQTTFRSIIQSPENSILNSSKFQITASGSSSNTTADVSDISNRLDYYRYANLTTTRSNVFAVWLTMGFFEVNENDAVTNVELGSNSGERKRYRAFYMIDRTIPVGFEKGRNHNADKVIILKRMLQ
ncbi:MAG: hypothetical protein Q4A17_14800 [Thermoguttaceae bacterium]|nr:hypothetical protein [Thermoguttaceae bacterium]